MNKFLFISLLSFLSICSFAQSIKKEPFYELRVYYTEEGRMPALIQRFTNHTTRIFEKHGMKNIGYWLDNQDTNKMLYVLEYPNQEARNSAWKAFSEDAEWKKVASDSEKDGKIVRKVESIYMNLTDFSPSLKIEDIHSPDRSFNLRTYTMLPGRYPNIAERFKKHTIKLFEKHGMTNIAYFKTIEKEGVEPRLIYILAHPSESAGKASFEAFRKDPKWLKVKSKTEKDFEITKSVETVYMSPLKFSKIK